MDLKGYSVSWKRHRKEPFFAAHHNTRRQNQCILQANNHVHVASEQTYPPQNHSQKLASFTSQTTTPPMLPASFVALLLLFTSITPAALSHPLKANQTFRAGEEVLKLRRIRTHLKKINKPAVKTIQAFSLCSITCVAVWQWHYIFLLVLCSFGDLGVLLFCCRVQMVIW